MKLDVVLVGLQYSDDVAFFRRKKYRVLSRVFVSESGVSFESEASDVRGRLVSICVSIRRLLGLRL